MDKVFFAFSNGSQSAIIPVWGWGAPDAKGRWFSNDIDLARFFENPWTISYGIDKYGAEAILQDCTMISLVGQRIAQGDTAPADFIVDDLKWSNRPYTLDSVPVNKSVDSLRKYADVHNLKIGSVLLEQADADYMMDPRYVQTLAQEFNLVSGINTTWPLQNPANPADLRNTMTNPGVANADARLAREIKFSERMRLQLIFEAFNVTNRVQITGINTTQYNVRTLTLFPRTDFQQVSGAGTNLFGPRQLQLGARFSF